MLVNAFAIWILCDVFAFKNEIVTGHNRLPLVNFDANGHSDFFYGTLQYNIEYNVSVVSYRTNTIYVQQ